MGYSIKTGLLEHGVIGAETASETPLWRKLVPKFTRGVLYLLDLGFFERQLFADAQAAGAHMLMRLKSNAKVRVVGHALDDGSAKMPGWSLKYYLQFASRRRGTVFDLDVIWGKRKEAIALRLVGVAHTSSNIRWYLTTVPRELLSAEQVIQSYRLRWLVEIVQSSCAPCHSGLCGREPDLRAPAELRSYTKRSQSGEFLGVGSNDPRTSSTVIHLAAFYPAVA
jgi:hypothetical protein